jgi:hypothetical protein
MSEWKQRTAMELVKESGVLEGYEGEPSRLEFLVWLVRHEALIGFWEACKKQSDFQQKVLMQALNNHGMPRGEE